MTTATDWRSRVGDIWAAEWRRTDRSLADLSRHLDPAILDVAAEAGQALDLGCGAGATSLTLAAARPDLAIIGLDLSPALLDVARARAAGTTLRFAKLDVAHDDLTRFGRPDLIVSRHGVMFFADPVAAFTRLRAIAAPNARLVFTCFAERHRNAFACDLPHAVLGEAPSDPPGYRPGPFGFADPAFVARLLAAAGWQAGEPRRVSFDYVVGEGSDPVADAAGFLSQIGPLAAPLAAEPGRRPLLAAALDRYRRADRIVLPAEAWLWHARAGEAA